MPAICSRRMTSPPPIHLVCMLPSFQYGYKSLVPTLKAFTLVLCAVSQLSTIAKECKEDRERFKADREEYARKAEQQWGNVWKFICRVLVIGLFAAVITGLPFWSKLFSAFLKQVGFSYLLAPCMRKWHTVLCRSHASLQRHTGLGTYQGVHWGLQLKLNLQVVLVRVHATSATTVVQDLESLHLTQLVLTRRISMSTQAPPSLRREIRLPKLSCSPAWYQEALLL